MTDAAPDAAKKTVTLESIPWYAVPAVLVGVPALLAILSLIFPEQVGQGFVVQYFWDPLKAGGQYNLYNTIGIAVLLGVSLLGLTQMMTALKIKVDTTFILGALAWVVTGSIFRIVEDTTVFRPPLRYFMITPPIYLVGAAFAIVALLVGIYMAKCAEARDREFALQKLWFIDAIAILAYVLAWALELDIVRIYLSPLTVALLLVFNHFLIRFRIQRVGEIRPSEMMLMQAIAPFLMGIAYLVLFVLDPWRVSGAGIPSAAITVPLLAIGLSGTVVSAIRIGDKERKEDHKWTIGFAAFFTVMLGIVIWTAPAATRTAPSLASAASILGIGVVLGGFSVLMSRLLRRRADVVHIIVLVILAILVYAIGFAAANYLLTEVFNQTPAAWSLHGIAGILVAYLFLNNRNAIQKTNAYLKRNGHVASHITAAFLVPLNVLLIVGQTMDGFATSVGLDLGGYQEKHILSASLIEGFHGMAAAVGWTFGTTYPTFLGFVPVKLGISLAVIYAIDIYSREDVKQYPNMIGLVKFAIIMVGLGPAVRDFGRLALGV